MLPECVCRPEQAAPDQLRLSSARVLPVGLCAHPPRMVRGGLTSIMRPKRQNGGRDALSTCTACSHPTFKSCGEAYHAQEASPVHGNSHSRPGFAGRHTIIRCFPAGSVAHPVRPLFPITPLRCPCASVLLFHFSLPHLPILYSNWIMRVGVHPSRHTTLQLLAKTNRP